MLNTKSTHNVQYPTSDTFPIYEEGIKNTLTKYDFTILRSKVAAPVATVSDK